MAEGNALRISRAGDAPGACGRATGRMMLVAVAAATGAREDMPWRSLAWHSRWRDMALASVGGAA